MKRVSIDGAAGDRLRKTADGGSEGALTAGEAARRTDFRASRRSRGRGGRRARSGLLGMDIDGGLLLCEAAPGADAVCRRAAWIRPAGDAVRPDGDPEQEEHVHRFVQGLREAVAQNGWRGFRVAIAAPQEHIALRHVALPRMPLRALRTALSVELERRVHLPFDDPLYDFHVQQADGEETGELSIIVVAAPRREVMPWVRLCADAGLRPVAVEPALLGMARVLAPDGVVPATAAAPGVDVLVSLGWGGVALGVMRGSDLVFMRHIAVRPTDYMRDERTGEDGEDGYAADVGHELDRSLAFIQYNFLKDGQAVRRVLLLDKVGAFGRVAAVLRDRVDFAVELATLSFAVDKGCVPMLAQWPPGSRAAAGQVAAAAFGLAAREVPR